MCEYVDWEDYCLKNPVDFPVLPDCQTDEFNIKRIHPYKQHEVLAIQRYLKTVSFVTFAQVFGSSTNMKCTWHSDVDIAIGTSGEETRAENNDMVRNVYELCENGCDVLDWAHIDVGTKIYANINRGVRII